jgi:hypothetical protein
MDFTAQTVAWARKMSARGQARTGKALYPLVGRWRIRYAEDVGPALLSAGGDTAYAAVAAHGGPIASSVTREAAAGVHPA